MVTHNEQDFMDDWTELIQSFFFLMQKAKINLQIAILKIFNKV